MNKCTNCGFELELVYAADGKRIARDVFYCAECGTVFKGSDPVIFDDQLRLAAKAYMKEATEVIEKTVKDMEKDPDLRIRAYFQNVFLDGFMLGFSKCVELMTREDPETEDE